MSTDKKRFLARYGTREHALDAIHNSGDNWDHIACGIMSQHISLGELQRYMHHDDKHIRSTAHYMHEQMRVGNMPKKAGMP